MSAACGKKEKEKKKKKKKERKERKTQPDCKSIEVGGGVSEGGKVEGRDAP